ncbi:transcriptional regulator family: Fungal Specific TF [Paecilomyces variotii]|nr:transcriptional regulator family: Fungal Specific TF [Paecilomyces variotii]KAJ9265845.1 transcriptional regulator family: Fungal Specific TF [Paecilomyces variotii]KAJ9291441.1 transcriptional regulator family: Fungal Specific TF [Paecilomyces variotii]KAJ9402726.1 transcriptional regulator family: Fungal Specific TF [Paecilomyces variotii]
MPTRRPHSKSRLGCTQCKRRRIKCDEKTPRCGNCIKHNIDCVYTLSPVNRRLLTQSASTPQSSVGSPNSVSLPEAQSSGLGHGSSNSQSPASDPLVILDPSVHRRDVHLTSDLHLHDLELMHHYSTVSYKTITDRESSQLVWQISVPREAVIHPFLMHGLLALSALHILELNENSQRRQHYIDLATTHQSMALALFRKELNDITPSNCRAMFAFSSIAAVLALAFTHTTGAEPLPLIDEMLQIFNLLRGIHEVVQAASEWIEKIADFFPPNVVIDPLSVPQEVRDNIAALEVLNADVKRTGLSDEEKEACEHAIAELLVSFEKIYSDLGHLIAFRWPVIIKPLYISLLRDRQPMALVILAHYCVPLHTLGNRWWLKSWGYQLLETIYHQLDISWRDTIRWPVEAVGLAKT